MIICLASSRLLWYPDLGGHAWVYMNWALGLQANGCTVVFLETLREEEQGQEVLRRLHVLQNNFAEVGLDARVALALSPRQRNRLEHIREQIECLTVPLEQVAAEAELLLNFKYSLPENIVNRFRRRILVDIDPGLLQCWVNAGQLRIAEHDVYFTIGETVGQPETLFPDCGLDWQYTAPAVFLPAWLPSKAEPSQPYTTISNWWAESDWEDLQGDIFNNEKRTSFLEYLDLPAHSSIPLELALFIGPETEAHERQLLESKGWRVRNSLEVSSTPQQYRSYIQDSRGEFSCAKPSCMRFQNAWISDRTLCYLASAKPAVVQYTGPSRFLPDADGLIRFRDLDEAARGLAAVEKDYEKHCRHARHLAEQYFDATKVAKDILEKALSARARQR